MWALRFATATVIAFVFVWTNIAAAEDADWHGITFETLTADTAAKNGLTLPFGALITEVNKQSPAHGKLTPGDAIIAAGGQAIINADALTSTLNAVAGGGSLTLVRNRQGTAPTQITIARAAAPRPKLKVVATLPTLMLDTGGHMTLIRDIVYTPDGKQLVSAGDDKVIRVWDVATRRTVRTMRGNVEPGDPGKIFSMAMSPDGKWLAVGGWLKEGSDTGQHIRMYDFATGEIRALLRGHTNVILGLHFSRDGSLLMSGGSDDIGILWRAPKQGTLVDWSRGQLVHKFKGHKDRINAVAILPGNRRGVTGADDDTAILWDLTTGEKIATMGGHTDHIYSLDVARDGTVATGDDSGGVHIWSLAQLNRATGGTITAERTWKQRAGIGQVAFSPDSRYLLTTCGNGPPCGGQPQIVWRMSDGKRMAQPKHHSNVVLAGTWSPDSRSVVTGGGQNNRIALWDPMTGNIRPAGSGNPDFFVGVGKRVWATAVSTDGQWIGWGNLWRKSDPANGYGDPQFAFRLPFGDATLAPPVRLGSGRGPTDWRRALPASGNLALKHRKGGNYGYNANLDIVEGDKVRATISRGPTTGYGHWAYSFSPDLRTVISSGANGDLMSYDRNGKLRGKYIGHEGVIWALVPSADGRFVVTGSDDQTVRLWNLETRELIATLFHAPRPDGEVGEWVIWTPQGFYTGSAGGGRLVGWQLNNGPDQAADYVTGGQFRDRLNRRDIIEEAIRLASAKAAVAKLEPNHDLARLLSARPPSLTLVTPEPYAEEFRGSANITVFVAPGSFDVDRYEVTVNGVSVPTVRGTVPPGHQRPPRGQVVEAFSVPLADGRNAIEIKAISAAGESQALTVPLNHVGEGPLDTRGKLYVVAVGVDNYRGLGQTCGASGNETCDLSYAGKDARLFIDTVAKQLGQRHTQGVWSRLLTNNARGSLVPTAQNILAALDGLENANETDTVAVFLAGHGERGRDGKYYFLPTDVSRGGGFNAVGTGRNIIEWSQIQKRLTAAKGRRMLFLDSCQSGAVGATRAYNGRLLEDAQYESFVAFMAAGPNQAAIERPDIGHGLFTHAVTQGITGAAMQPGESIVRVLALGGYVADRVWRLSSGRQRPVYTPHSDFVLTAAK